MSTHPLNLGLRFLLELAALAAMGYWGWQQGDGFLSFVYAFGIPLIVAVLWGTFAVPDDPSRSGKAPVPTLGWIRLLLETAVFGFGAWALIDVGRVQIGLIFIVMTLIHYVASFERLAWILRQ